MKLNKGTVIYGMITLGLLILLLMPDSTVLFNTAFSQLSGNYSWQSYMPDVLSIVMLIIGYVILRVFYKKHALYIKRYPLYLLAVAIVWTIVSQMK